MESTQKGMRTAQVRLDVVEIENALMHICAVRAYQTHLALSQQSQRQVLGEMSPFIG